MIKKIACATTVLLFFSLINAAETLTDSFLGYSIFLPDNWVREIANSTDHRFFDTSQTYQSMVAIVRYDFSADTIFSAPDEWTRANFIAYTLSVSADPFCNLVFYDTVTVKQNGALWATDVLTEFYSYDSTIGDWAEYIRFTASGTYGYELYAIGPLSDLDSNVALYGTIIDGIVLPVSNASVFHPGTGTRTVRTSKMMTDRFLDALGRRHDKFGPHCASKIIITRFGSSCVLRNAGTFP